MAHQWKRQLSAAVAELRPFPHPVAPAAPVVPAAPAVAAPAVPVAAVAPAAAAPVLVVAVVPAERVVVVETSFGGSSFGKEAGKNDCAVHSMPVVVYSLW